MGLKKKRIGILWLLTIFFRIWHISGVNKFEYSGPQLFCCFDKKLISKPAHCIPVGVFMVFRSVGITSFFSGDVTHDDPGQESVLSVLDGTGKRFRYIGLPVGFAGKRGSERSGLLLFFDILAVDGHAHGKKC